jgi:hypothetical protein
MGTRSEVEETIYIKIRAYTYIYMHIHAYTILVGICLYIYIFLTNSYLYLHIHAYTIWKIIYARNGFLNSLHVYCTYLHVFARICCSICTYVHVWPIMWKSMRLATFSTKIRTKYVQNTYIRPNTAEYTCIYVHNIRTIYCQIRYMVYDSICMYMHVYASICKYIRILNIYF